MSPAAVGGPRVPPPAAGGPPGSLAARINVTVPLAALLGLSGTPGEVAAFGPVDADVTRDLIAAAGLHPATRWCVTVVSPDGQAIGHGCARGRHPAPQFSPDSGTDPPGTGGSPPGGGDDPPGRGDGPGGNGTPRGGGNAVPGTGRETRRWVRFTVSWPQSSGQDVHPAAGRNDHAAGRGDL